MPTETPTRILPVTLTVSETAAYLGVSDDTIYELVRRKEIPHIRLRSRILFRRDTLDAWMTQMERQSIKGGGEKS